MHPGTGIIRRMPLPLAVLFRVTLLLVMIGYAALMYRLVRDITGMQPGTLRVVSLCAVGTLVLMVPLIWIVGLPELPEIYVKWWRAMRRWRYGRCPACDYQRLDSQTICPECGQQLVEPQPYRFSARTIIVFITMIIVAWLVGCALGELFIESRPQPQPPYQVAPAPHVMPMIPSRRP